MKKGYIVKVERVNKRRQMVRKITTDGKTFINIYYDDIDSGFEIEFSESETKEFFRKIKSLKKTQP